MKHQGLGLRVKGLVKKTHEWEGDFVYSIPHTLYPRLRGFTLLEVLLGIVLLVFISVSLYTLFSFAINMIWESRVRINASAIANERIERARNLPYNSVGTIGGIPSGTLTQTQIVTMNNVPFTIQTSVIYIDDPFDGTLDGNPNDSLNTDYKRVRVMVTWPYRLTHTPVVMLTDIAPKGIESTAGGGTLKITVLNSYGYPVSNADVHITNSGVTPAVDLTTQTNSGGLVILPGAAPSNNSYNIVVSKSGYSTDQTRAPTTSLPAPAIAPVSVFLGQTSSVSFSIDVVGVFNITTNSYPSGNQVGSVSFKLSGSKSIGLDSSGLQVFKYLNTPSSDGGGFVNLTDMEWDSYTFSFATSTTYDLAGINPINPVILSAGSTTPVAVYVSPKSDHSLLVAVKQADSAFVTEALVQIDRTGYLATSTTPAWGQVFFRDIVTDQYNVSVTKSGFAPYSGQVTVTGATQEVVTMTPL